MKFFGALLLPPGAAAIVLSTLGAGGCDFRHTSHFTIRVDSISAPASVSATDTLRVRFFGFVGPDACWSLESVERQATAWSLDVTFRGAHEEGVGFSCAQMVVYLDHREQVGPPLIGPFKITVQEPGDIRLTRTVTVQ